MSSSYSNGDGYSQQRASNPDTTEEFLRPPTSLLTLPDDLLLTITSFINDFDGLWGFSIVSKRTATIFESEDAWRGLMRLHSWHPRWDFDYYTSQHSLDAPDRWRREYLWTLGQCIDVWKGIVAIKDLFRWSERLTRRFFGANKPTPESDLVELERNLNHPLPNDLKELMRIVGGFTPHQELFDYIEANEDLMQEWASLFHIRPIAEWELSRTKLHEHDVPLLYNEDEISEELPPYDVVEGWNVEIAGDVEAEESDSFPSASSGDSEELESVDEEERDFLRIGGIIEDFDTLSLDISTGLLISEGGPNTSVSQLMRFAMDNLAHPKINFEYVTSYLSAENDMEDVESASFDEDDLAIGTLAHECLQEFVTDGELSPNAIKLFSKASNNFLAEAFRNTQHLDVFPGMISAQAFKLFFPAQQRCMDDAKLLETLAPTIGVASPDSEAPADAELSQK